ncbi:MAG: hypothetical protein IPI11_01490 [Haliscomenobacter sp.]|nr:hypothetical protein [Haliscomenobacter sp.]
MDDKVKSGLEELAPPQKSNDQMFLENNQCYSIFKTAKPEPSSVANKVPDSTVSFPYVAFFKEYLSGWASSP